MRVAFVRVHFYHLVYFFFNLGSGLKLFLNSGEPIEGPRPLLARALTRDRVGAVAALPLLLLEVGLHLLVPLILKHDSFKV